MKHISGLFSGALLFFFMLPLTARAAVMINEIAWMGTASSQYSEWIELYNSGEDAVALEGWKIIKGEDQALFTLTKHIASKGYVLIERTTASAPDAVPGVNDESGTFGGGGLKNTGEDLALKDKDGNTMDSVLFAGGWPAGDAKTKDTMQWNGTKWISAPGTPDAMNADVTPAPVENPDTSTPTETQTPAITTTTATPDTATPTVTPVTVPVTTTTVTSTIQTPAATTPQVTSPVPAIATSTATKTVTTPVVTAPSKTAPAAKTTAKKTATVKKASSTKAATSDDANDLAADQLQANADVPKENNHTKIIIFGAVAFIGMALFLLLDRFKVSKE